MFSFPSSFSFKKKKEVSNDGIFVDNVRSRRQKLLLTLQTHSIMKKGPKANQRRMSIPLQRKISFHTMLSTRSSLKEAEFETYFDKHKEIQWEDLKNITHLADGGMCRVFKAELNNGQQCVVKKPLPPDINPEQDKIRESLASELEILQQVNHPNIVSFYGSGYHEGELFVAMERLDGCLSLGIKSRESSKPKKHISVIDALKLALEISLGMAYLHDQAIFNCIIMHRDLKPDNLCFAANGYLKIVDLGLAVVVDRTFRARSDMYNISGGVGSLRYMAPEVGLCKTYNEKADVYSFSMIFWEMLSSVPPYWHIGSPGELQKRVFLNGERPVVHKNWNPLIKDLLVSCWAADVDARPSFREIVNKLGAMIIEELEPKPARQKSGFCSRMQRGLSTKSRERCSTV